MKNVKNGLLSFSFPPPIRPKLIAAFNLPPLLQFTPSHTMKLFHLVLLAISHSICGLSIPSSSSSSSTKARDPEGAFLQSYNFAENNFLQCEGERILQWVGFYLYCHYVCCNNLTRLLRKGGGFFRFFDLFFKKKICQESIPVF